MKTRPVSSSQIRSTRGTSALLALLLAGATLTGFSQQALANDADVVLSTGFGAVAGAIIGHAVGGRNGTIVGGALGAAVGASAATQGGNYRNGPPSGYYRDDRGNQGGYNAYPQQAPVVYAPAVQVYRPAPVIYQPVYQPIYRTEFRPYVRPVVFYRGGHDDRYDSDDRRDRHEQGHHGWDRDDDNRRDSRRDDRHGWDNRR